ncbi:class I SAM-dependent methyltransferase [Sphingomonas sp. BAUL-RG-20F-R05-02]|uniref:class I SAM-dependent methyltransferase n=1 Tax=Sphingomonas sp. BAUL-RG-20F-R05-02 TaxID=2914830 RepID=UPI001F57D45F|nr:class I SAM-dependent methyltransferase [Sphingomonas sp. BAUL-RG-20F-R05-02]
MQHSIGRNCLPYRIDIPGQVSEAQLQAIEVVATLVPAGGCVVEVGSLFGRSSWAWARSVPETATVVCVDPWEGNEGAHEIGGRTGYGYGYDSFSRYTKECTNIIPIRAYSPDGVCWSRPIDCYYEDAVHIEPILSRNIDFWTSFLRPTGIICGDDYRPRFPDVRQAAEKIAKKLNRRLFLVDFFWCVLPDPADVPGVKEVAEKLRAIAAETVEANSRLPAAIHISPLVPPARKVPAGQNHVLKMRVTNDGMQDWPEKPEQPLTVRVKQTGSADGRVHVMDIPLGCNELSWDQAILFDIPLSGSRLDAAVIEVECHIAGHDEDSRATPFSHRLAVTDAGEHFIPPAELTIAKLRFDTGWSDPEADFRWSVGFRSRLVLDAVPAADDEPLFLNLALHPFVTASIRRQRLMLLINGSPVIAGTFNADTLLSVPIPKNIGNSFILDFIHPEAHQPAASSISSTDRRSLGFALKSVTFSIGKPNVL